MSNKLNPNQSVVSGKSDDYSQSDDYTVYVEDEWQAFHRDAQRRRGQAIQDAVRITSNNARNYHARNDVRGKESLERESESLRCRVLDIGCGAGQEMLPLIADGQAFGVSTLR